jgi:electron transfer flavoprotein alpha subunit
MSDNAVVVCTWGQERDGLPAGAEEVLTIGRGLAEALGKELDWLVLGPMPDAVPAAAGRYGVSGLKQIESPKLEQFQADVVVEAVASYCGSSTPCALLLHQTLDARVAAPRIAGRLGTAVVMNGIAVEPRGNGLVITASAYGGDTRREYEVEGASDGAGCPVISFIANAVIPAPGEGAAASVESLPSNVDAINERVKVVEQASFDGPRLDDAEIIVSGGRGLGDQSNYKLIEQLAEALGGLPGASRPLVDDGWVDSSRQVGLTGRITRPNLYVAIGISGASQHMAGCSAAKTLVAINRDADAAIFQHARYGIVGDCLELLPELIRAAGAR